MTPELAVKTINHIQKVFYVVGALNVFFATLILVTSDFNVYAGSLIISILIGLAIVFMGWALNKPYRYKIPKAAFILSALLLVVNIINLSIVGLIFPVALWIIGKQSQRAITVLENLKK